MFVTETFLEWREGRREISNNGLKTLVKTVVPGAARQLKAGSVKLKGKVCGYCRGNEQ